MDSEVIDFLTNTDKPCTALDIAKGVGKTTGKEVKPTLHELEKEGRVQQKGTVKGRQTPLWVLVQSGNSDQDEIASDMSRLSIASWKDSLSKHHQELRTGILIHNFLPALKGLPLTDTEYAQISDKAGNVSQVDEMIAILHTKTRRHFDKFCSVLEDNEYQHWARRLRGEDNGHQGETPTRLPVGSHPPAKEIASPPLNAATPPEHPVTDDQRKSQRRKMKKENVQFVFITANENEYVSLMSFLKHPECRLPNVVETTFEDIDELKGRIKMKRNLMEYCLFSVRGSSGNKIKCAVLKCLSMGSSGCWGSRMETLQLLITARDRCWSPEAIFIIGCCGGIKVPKSDACAEVEMKVPEPDDGGRKEPVVGRVCVAGKVIHYNRGKIEGEGDMKWKPTTDYSSKKNTWYGHVLKVENVTFPQKKVPYKTIDRFLSGDHVVKSEDAAKKLSQFGVDPTNVAIEMEGLGVAEALEIAEMVNGKVIQDDSIKIPLPEYVIVKGISDLAGRDKKEACDIQFFGEEKKDVIEDHRQQMCTIMAATLVLRAIVHFT